MDDTQNNSTSEGRCTPTYLGVSVTFPISTITNKHRMTDDNTPTVHYVPGAVNRYEPRENAVVLDERLKNYPKAHEHVLKHELSHANPENQSFTGFLAFEFYHDIESYFSDDDAIGEIREYYLDEAEAGEEKYAVGNMIRGVWTPPMRLAGLIYLALKNTV